MSTTSSHSKIRKTSGSPSVESSPARQTGGRQNTKFDPSLAPSSATTASSLTTTSSGTAPQSQVINTDLSKEDQDDGKKEDAPTTPTSSSREYRNVRTYEPTEDATEVELGPGSHAIHGLSPPDRGGFLVENTTTETTSISSLPVALPAELVPISPQGASSRPETSASNIPVYMAEPAPISEETRLGRGQEGKDRDGLVVSYRTLFIAASICVVVVAAIAIGVGVALAQNNDPPLSLEETETTTPVGSPSNASADDPTPSPTDAPTIGFPEPPLAPQDPPTQATTPSPTAPTGTISFPEPPLPPGVSPGKIEDAQTTPPDPTPETNINCACAYYQQQILWTDPNQKILTEEQERFLESVWKGRLNQYDPNLVFRRALLRYAKRQLSNGQVEVFLEIDSQLLFGDFGISTVTSGLDMAYLLAYCTTDETVNLEDYHEAYLEYMTSQENRFGVTSSLQQEVGLISAYNMTIPDRYEDVSCEYPR